MRSPVVYFNPPLPGRACAPCAGSPSFLFRSPPTQGVGARGIACRRACSSWRSVSSKASIRSVATLHLFSRHGMPLSP